MKLDKVLCFIFFRFFGLDGAQNTIVVYSVLKRKTKDCIVQGRGHSNINLDIFVSSFDVYRPS